MCPSSCNDAMTCCVCQTPRCAFVHRKSRPPRRERMRLPRLPGKRHRASAASAGRAVAEEVVVVIAAWVVAADAAGAAVVALAALALVAGADAAVVEEEALPCAQCI